MPCCRAHAQELDTGKDVHATFLTGDDFAFELSAGKIDPKRFKISFGCIAAPTEGDGRE